VAQMQHVRELFDLTDPGRNMLFNLSLDQARRRVASGDARRVREIEGHFALVARRGPIIRMARSLGLPMRYFIVKRADGPALLVADRIDAIRDWLDAHDYGDQFHPTYTRMVPAHYITEIALVGCPDPNPTYIRFFSPKRETLPADLDAIGQAYIGALATEIDHWLCQLDDREPIGVCFSGGIDSGAVFLVTYHLMQAAGMNPARLKAFTLDVKSTEGVEDAGDDVDQARRFLDAVDLQLFHEMIEVPASYIDLRETVRVVEDYKPLDVQAAAMVMGLCRGIRERYPTWRNLIDGDGGDENLKDYPIEENPELTIHSVLNNRMLYHEGWGVESIKHSLVYSGGLSRGCTRTYAPARHFGFTGFSPFTLPNVVEPAEAIPFIELTGWEHARLYDLKGEVVRRGVEAVTGTAMPIFTKRRFQHGAAHRRILADRLSASPNTYRRTFQSIFDDAVATS